MYKAQLQRLLQLHQSTPAPVVYFLAGSLPLLHSRMISLFGQLCRLRGGNNILARHGMNVFSSANSSKKSWFWKLVFILQNSFNNWQSLHASLSPDLECWNCLASQPQSSHLTSLQKIMSHNLLQFIIIAAEKESKAEALENISISTMIEIFMLVNENFSKLSTFSSDPKMCIPPTMLPNLKV